MDSLPREVILNILSRLPVLSLVQTKFVCRAWSNLLRDPQLAHMHFSRAANSDDPCLILHCDCPIRNQLFCVDISTHNPENESLQRIHAPSSPEFDIVGSSNGLLCLCDPSGVSAACVCNPFTGEHTQLPKSAFLEQESVEAVVFGFGYHSGTKEYKVVKIISYTDPNSVVRRSEVQIFTLGSLTWRSLGHVSYHLIKTSTQVLLNGRLHWVSWPSWFCRLPFLVSFDLEDEQFRKIPKPYCCGSIACGHQLVVLGDCLSAAAFCNNGKCEIWVMKEYGEQDSWVKEYSIGTYLPRDLEEDVDQYFKNSKFYLNSGFVRVLCLLKNGEILLEYECRALVSYSPNTGTFTDLVYQGIPGDYKKFPTVTTHTPLEDDENSIRKMTRHRPHMESLPREIAVNILSRLPITSLANVKLVCQSWLNLAQDPLLGRLLLSPTVKKNPCLILHSDYSAEKELFAADLSDDSNIEALKKNRVPTNLPKFQVACSCNGLLLCISDSLHSNRLFIYNPFTVDWMELPASRQYPNQQVVIGVGLCPGTNKYKVVKVVHYSPKGMIRPYGTNFPEIEVHVFDFGSFSWRCLGQIPYQLFHRPPQALVNGRLHWVSWPTKTSSGCLIVSFDTEDEQFREVPKPVCGSLDKFNYHVVDLGGYLSASVYPRTGQFEIWVMKEYDVQGSWIKQYNIQIVAQCFRNSRLHLEASHARVICLLKNGHILLDYRGRALVSFDPKRGTFRHITLHGLGMPKRFKPTVHVGALSWIGNTIGS
ncbi:hypothetical protein Tsubulata_049119 [Turnera subulata]|uniref:F-box domain-containing protein n=1 Tax=Turnera subulata TaxID=218843 RepID=A0A9Q0F910_9ROSI|nr:hypothetical protein Tsubulata_049119 [Turnera subulata]